MEHNNDQVTKKYEERMNDPEVKRPSNFALSRYMLGECNPAEKFAIESWILLSDETRQEFALYKNAVLKEEQKASPALNQPFLEKIQLLPLFHRIAPKVRIRFVSGIVTAMFFVSVISVYILKNAPVTDHGLKSQENDPYPNGFRDTLVALLRLTGTENCPSGSLLQGGDWTVQSVALNSELVQNPGFSRADRTMVFSE